MSEELKREFEKLKGDHDRLRAVVEGVTDAIFVEDQQGWYVKSLRALPRRALEIQEQERRHLARELHEEIGQALCALSINLQAANVGDASATQSRLTVSIHIVDQTIQQIRNLSLDLWPIMLDDLGLVPTLRWYADQQAQAAGFALNFEVKVAGSRLSPGLEITCYRVAQEALTNVLQHAQAKQVWLEYWQSDDEVWLRIRDDGIGFDTTAVRQRSVSQITIGLLGMQERVELWGGKFDVGSQPGKGTTLQVWLPVSPLSERSMDIQMA